MRNEHSIGLGKADTIVSGRKVSKRKCSSDGVTHFILKKKTSWHWLYFDKPYFVLFASLARPCFLTATCHRASIKKKTKTHTLCIPLTRNIPGQVWFEKAGWEMTLSNQLERRYTTILELLEHRRVVLWCYRIRLFPHKKVFGRLHFNQTTNKCWSFQQVMNCTNYSDQLHFRQRWSFNLGHNFNSMYIFDYIHTSVIHLNFFK